MKALGSSIVQKDTQSDRAQTIIHCSQTLNTVNLKRPISPEYWMTQKPYLESIPPTSIWSKKAPASGPPFQRRAWSPRTTSPATQQALPWQRHLFLNPKSMLGRQLRRSISPLKCKSYISQHEVHQTSAKSDHPSRQSWAPSQSNDPMRTQWCSPASKQGN